MKSLVSIFSVILADASITCKTPIERDFNYSLSRIKDEGLSYLTITLPSYAKAFEQCLEHGQVLPNLFPSFRKNKKGLPKFLSGFLAGIFDNNGILRENPNIDAIEAVRQICYFASKIRNDCTDERLKKAIQKYKQCENDISSFRLTEWRFKNDFFKTFNLLFGTILRNVEENLHTLPLLCKHGPGTTADRTKGNQKYNYRKWTKRLERKGIYSSDYLSHDYMSFNCISVETVPDSNVRVVFVPKTQTTPRVIAIEPVHMQYVQQGLMRLLTSSIEASYLRKNLLFSDQTVNSAIALSSSVSKTFATLDLSEASDRVPSSMVHFALTNFPLFREQVFACRSLAATLPNGENIRLKKFASMGSALCFPIEAMVFFALSVLSQLNQSDHYTSSYVARVASRTYVFGDDICIKREWVSRLVDVLHSTPLRVNMKKTFHKGFFRESCGTDAYRGYRVTPVYLREMPPESRIDVESIVGYVESSNLFYLKGYWNTSQLLRDIVSKFLLVPFMRNDSSSIRYISSQQWHTYQSYDKDRHAYFGYYPAVKSKMVSDVTDEHSYLLKYFTESGALTSSEQKNYLKSIKRNTMRIVKKRIYY